MAKRPAEWGRWSPESPAGWERGHRQHSMMEFGLCSKVKSPGAADSIVAMPISHTCPPTSSPVPRKIVSPTAGGRYGENVTSLTLWENVSWSRKPIWRLRKRFSPGRLRISYHWQDARDSLRLSTPPSRWSRPCDRQAGGEWESGGAREAGWLFPPHSALSGRSGMENPFSNLFTLSYWAPFKWGAFLTDVHKLGSTGKVCSELYSENLRCRGLASQGLSAQVRSMLIIEVSGFKSACGQPPWGLGFRFCFCNFLFKIRS